jgi:hypothetical protein
MIHLLLLDLVDTEQFGITWDLMDEMETAGTTHSLGLAKNEYYKKAVAAWVVAKKAHRQRIIDSKIRRYQI